MCCMGALADTVVVADIVADVVVDTVLDTIVDLWVPSLEDKSVHSSGSESGYNDRLF
jgi:hypothetical protein